MVKALVRDNPRELADEPPMTRRRVGGRSARVLESVVAAVVEELAAEGMENFSIPKVAARAGISSSSIYRRWPTKTALIAFAGGKVAERNIPAPDRGTLRGDLLRVLDELKTFIDDPNGQALIAFAFSSLDSEEVQHAQRKFWKRRVELLQPIFSRAIERGEILPTTDVEEIIERTIGPLYVRSYISRRPLSKAFLERTVDAALLVGKPRVKTSN